MKAGIAVLLLIIGGFLIYEVVIGNGPTIIEGLRQSTPEGTGQAGGGGGDFGTAATTQPTTLGRKW